MHYLSFNQHTPFSIVRNDNSSPNEVSDELQKLNESSKRRKEKKVCEIFIYFIFQK